MGVGTDRVHRRLITYSYSNELILTGYLQRPNAHLGYRPVGYSDSLMDSACLSMPLSRQYLLVDDFSHFIAATFNWLS